MLQLDLTTILFQMANFVVLVVGLTLFVFRPLRSKLRERRHDLAELQQSARDQEAEANHLKAQWEERMREAEKDAEEILRQARDDAQRRTEEMMEQARQRLDRLTEDMQESLDRQRDELLASQFDDILDAILDVSGRVVQLVTTRRTHDDLVTNFNATIRRSPQPEVNKYRSAMEGRAPIAFVTTPAALKPEQTRALVDSLSALLDRHIDLEVETDTSLIAGLRVRVADTLFDNSIQAKLQEMRSRAGSDLIERLQVEMSDE